jgi:hypothetical protein
VLGSHGIDKLLLKSELFQINVDAVGHFSVGSIGRGCGGCVWFDRLTMTMGRWWAHHDEGAAC